MRTYRPVRDSSIDPPTPVPADIQNIEIRSWGVPVRSNTWYKKDKWRARFVNNGRGQLIYHSAGKGRPSHPQWNGTGGYGENRATRLSFLLGSDSTSNEELPRSLISSSFSCLKNPSFGQTAGLARMIRPSASFNDMSYFFIKYAATIVGERDTAAEQCTRILPALAAFNTWCLLYHWHDR